MQDEKEGEVEKENKKKVSLILIAKFEVLKIHKYVESKQHTPN